MKYFITAESLTCAEDIGAIDLQEEYKLSGADDPTDWEYYTAQTVGENGYINTGEEAIEILYSPQIGRAGIVWGADADWTDCDSAEDALDRFFGNNDKYMCN